MSVDATIRATVLANAAVTALLGTRLYPVTLDQNAINAGQPCATYQRIATTHDYAQDRSNANWGRTGWARMQFTAFGTGASGAEQARSVASAIRVSLKDFAAAFVINDFERVEPDTVPPIFMRILDTRIFITEES